MKIFFYQLEAHRTEAIKTLLENKFSSNDIDLVFEVIKDGDRINNMTKEEMSSVLIFSKKRELPFSTGVLQSFSDDVYDKLSLDIRKYIKTKFPKEYKFSIPLLIEPYYLIVKKDIDIRYFDISMKTSIYDESKFKNECKDGYPIMMVGGDDEALFLFLLFCMQSIKDGREEIKKSNADARMGTKEKREVFSFFDAHASIYWVLQHILALQKVGAFHPEWFRLKKEDVRMFLELSEVGMAFVARSEYQRILKENNFSYYPIDSSLISSPYPVPLSIIYLFEIEKDVHTNEKKTPVKVIEEYLMSKEGQKELGDVTSLLPSTFNDENIKDKSDILVIEDESSMEIEKIRDLPLLLKNVRQYFYLCGIGY